MTSEYAYPIFFVKKKDGAMCMYIDFCTLNVNTRMDQYPIPCIDSFIDWLHGAHVFSKMIYLQAIIRFESEKVTSTRLCFRVVGDCINTP